MQVEKKKECHLGRDQTPSNTVAMLAEHNLPPLEVSWLQRDVLLFANSIGVTADELHFLYVSLPLIPL